jgi:sarcosine oxidase subunit beta
MIAQVKTADCAIIGGGIIGVCTAYYLSAQAPLKIVLMEKNLLAQASTGLSAGGIRQQFSHSANIRMSQLTLKLLAEFSAEFDSHIDFRQVGYLFLAEKPATWLAFKDSIPIQRQHDVPVELLSPGEIQSRWPFLQVRGLYGGTFCGLDGYADPYSVTMAYAHAARKQGVCIMENAPVEKILSRSGRVEGLQTAVGLVSAPLVINAAGAWGADLAATVGLRLAIKPFRRQVFVTRRFTGIDRPFPLIIDQDALFYFREEGEGILMGMTDPEEPSSFHTHVDRNFLERLIEAATQRVPILAEAEILRGWGGLYAVTPDENPIIGHLGSIEGLYGALGFSGHGFQHGPAAGRILSEFILKGRTDIDLEPFAYNRFDRSQGPGEQRTV